MIGIVSYGGYIPRLRLDRMSIYQHIGWLAPAIVMAAQGERSMCNWDEDSLTIAVAASRDCLVGMDKKKVDALYLASTTLPFADRLNAGIVATALNLRTDILTADFASTQKAGTSAIVTALEAARNGKKVLVTASDKRETKAGSFYEMWFGDGAGTDRPGSAGGRIASGRCAGLPAASGGPSSGGAADGAGRQRSYRWPGLLPRLRDPRQPTRDAGSAGASVLGRFLPGGGAGRPGGGAACASGPRRARL